MLIIFTEARNYIGTTNELLNLAFKFIIIINKKFLAKFKNINS